MVAEPKIIVGKSIVVISAAVIACIGATCPCRPELYKCHLTSMMVSIGSIVAVLVYFNGMRIRSH